jgi:ArsR family transcriptional regulator, arsenate/arsenite/antimonite-responsive transcriptional repressor
MSLIQIYQCMCDQTRLRILNLLSEGPLCVCHLQEILGEPQVKISKHLAYLKAHGMVEVRREANWMIYRLPDKPSRELKSNLACLQDCAQEEPIFRSDREKLRQRRSTFTATSPICCPPKTANRKTATA